MKKKFDRGREVRAIARERVGPVKKGGAIPSKKQKLKRVRKYYTKEDYLRDEVPERE